MAWRDNTDPKNPECAGSCVSFIPRLWARAERDMEPHCSQVQVFHYDEPENDTQKHVVRDLNMPAGHQLVASFSEDRAERLKSATAARAEYARCHELAMEERRAHCIHLTWTHYRERIQSGAYSIALTQSKADEQ